MNENEKKLNIMEILESYRKNISDKIFVGAEEDKKGMTDLLNRVLKLAVGYIVGICDFEVFKDEILSDLLIIFDKGENGNIDNAKMFACAIIYVLDSIKRFVNGKPTEDKIAYNALINIFFQQFSKFCKIDILSVS